MSSETIRLGVLPDSFVELRVVQHGQEPGMSEGDLRLSVSVRADTFAGEYNQVWIAKNDWEHFLANLKRLERERTGQAALVSMSPDEFELRLQIIDRAGHLAAHGFLSRYHFGHPSGQAARSRVEYCADVDPSLLRELVLSFEALREQG